MKFHTLELVNFLTVRNAKINLADRGLHLIQGVNEVDSSAISNGAGKSSLVDAICWVLYGVTARNIKGDDVVNDGAKKNCSVSLEISSGSSRYVVKRHRKHATGKNSLVLTALSGDPEVATDMSRGTDAETQKVLEGILGCSLEVFMAAVYSGQEAMPDLPRMKDKELKMLIEQSAGLERIEKAYEIARERMSEAKRKVQSLEELLSNATEGRLRIEAELTEFTRRQDLYESERAGRVAAAEENHGDAILKYGDCKAELGKYDAVVDAARAKIEEIDVSLKTHKDALSAATAAGAAVHAAEREIDVSGLKRLDTVVKEHEARFKNAEDEVKKPCRACGTVLTTMSVEDFRAHEQKHIDEAREALNAAMTKARAQKAHVETLKTRHAELVAAVPDVSALTEKRSKLEALLSKHKDAIAEFDRASDQLRAASDAVTLQRTAANPHTGAVESWSKSLAEHDAKMGAYAADLELSKKRLDIANAAVKVFGPAGVRAQILDTVTPFLNARTADYLSVLTDGNATAVWTTLTKDSKGDLKEKFTIDVTHAKGGSSFNAISGGEKRKVRLATALALQDLVASRATQPIDLWVGDEVDDALDSAGLERLMTILERRARERGTVLVISHSDLRDWIDNVTTVRKAEQWSSTVEGSLCS